MGKIEFVWLLNLVTFERTPYWVVLAASLGIGVLQVFAPDRIAAIVPMMAKKRNLSRSALIGSWWGFGHWLALSAMSIFALGMHGRIDLEFELMLRFGVAVMLVSLGLNLLLQRLFAKPKALPGAAALPQGFKHGWRPFLIGAMQGCGESVAWLFAAERLASAAQKIFYLFMFGIGSIVGMMLMCVLLSLPADLSESRFPPIYRALPFIFGSYSVIYGLWSIYQIAVVKGLFANWN